MMSGGAMAQPGHNEYIVSEGLVAYHERTNCCILFCGILTIMSSTVSMFYGFGLDSSFKSETDSISSQGLAAIAAICAAVMAVTLSASQSSSCCFDVSKRPGHDFVMGGCCCCRTVYRGLMVINIIVALITAIATCVIAKGNNGVEGIAEYSTALLLVIIAVDEMIALYFSRQMTSGATVQTPLKPAALPTSGPIPDHSTPEWNDLRLFFRKLYDDHDMTVPQELLNA